MKKLLTPSLLMASSILLAQHADTVKTKVPKPDSIKVITPITESNKTVTSVTVSVAPQETFKATKGKYTTELNINPFQGNLSFNNALQQIKVRYFAANNLAYRFAFNFNSRSSNDSYNTVYGPYPYSSSDNKKTTTIGLGVGVEKHFAGTNKLSPYIGAEVSLVNKTASEKIKNGTYEEDINGAWQSSGPYGPIYTDERAYFRYGVNLVAGFDYYFVKNFYFGYEFAFQLYSTKYQKVDITTSNSSGPTPDNSSSETFIGPNLINGIRLGFIF